MLELKKKKRIIGALLVFTGLAVFCLSWFLSIGSGLKHIGALQAELSTKRRLVAIKDENLTNREGLKEDLQAYRQQLETAAGDPSLPANRGVIYCSSLMDDWGIEQTQLSIGEWEDVPEADSLQRVFFHISCLGRYEDVLAYIGELAESSFVYEISEIKLSSKNVADTAQVYAELQICLYSCGQGSEQVKEQKTTERGNPFYYYENK